MQQLKWLSLYNPNVVYPSNHFDLIFAAMATMSKAGKTEMTADLDAPIQGPVDPNLAFDSLKVEEFEVKRPPGISTLREWGQLVFPDGKWEGHSFVESFQEDKKYVQYILTNARLTSTWALSYKEYCKARLKAEDKAAERQDRVQKITKERLKEMSQYAPWKEPPSLSWEMISGTPASSSPATTKRGLETEETYTKMDVELDKMTRTEKLTQMALLQDRLDQLKNEMGNSK